MTIISEYTEQATYRSGIVFPTRCSGGARLGHGKLVIRRSAALRCRRCSFCYTHASVMVAPATHQGACTGWVHKPLAGQGCHGRQYPLGTGRRQREVW